MIVCNKNANREYGSESIEQLYLFKWAAAMVHKYPDLEYLYHTPNEGKRTRANAARRKAEGLKSGVPDVCLPVPRGSYRGLYIELKVGGNKVTDNQRRWLEHLDANGYLCAVCYGWDLAADLIENYLNRKGK